MGTGARDTKTSLNSGGKEGGSEGLKNATEAGIKKTKGGVVLSDAFYLRLYHNALRSRPPFGV